MPFQYNGDIMEKLKEAGWSEYKIRREKVLATSTIKAIKTGDTYITVRVLGRICEMLGGVQPGEVLIYTDAPARPHSTGSILDTLPAEEMERLYAIACEDYAKLDDPGVPPMQYFMQNIDKYLLYRKKT